LVNKEAVEWFLHGTSIQLQQCSTLWHDPIPSKLPLLPSLTATIIASHLQLEASVDTLELSIEPVLYAELSLIDVLGSNPAFRRIEESFEGLCQLLRSISILEEAINLTSFYHRSIYTTLHITAFSQTFHFYDTKYPLPPLMSFRIGVLLLYDMASCKKSIVWSIYHILSRLRH